MQRLDVVSHGKALNVAFVEELRRGDELIVPALYSTDLHPHIRGETLADIAIDIVDEDVACPESLLNLVLLRELEIFK